MATSNLRLGALYAVSAAVAFSLTGICVKAAAAEVSNELIVFFRSGISLLALLPWLVKTGPSTAIGTRRLKGHLVRAGFGILAMYSFFYAIAHLPLAIAMLLTYSTPLWIPFIAWFWMGEKPDGLVFPSVLLGLCGIALIVQPGEMPLDPTAGLIGLGSGVLAACAMVSIRRISDTEPAARIVFYFAAMATAISAVPLWWAWETPTLRNGLLLTGAGLTATVGQFMLTRAYASGPAARIGPFTYTAVIFSALLAAWIWQETLSALALTGMAVVVASCVMAGWQRKEQQIED